MEGLGGERECDYPHLDELVRHACRLACAKDCSTEDIDEELLILALDNEAEAVLDFIASHCQGRRLEQIVTRGVDCAWFDARWQMAELVYRTKPVDFRAILEKLTQDAHPCFCQWKLRLCSVSPQNPFYLRRHWNVSNHI